MSNRTVCGCAVNTAGRAMRAWFKRWRREFNVYGLPRLEPVKLGALAQLIGWRVTNAHCAEFAAFEALQKHVRATKDPALEALVSDYFAAVKETEATASAVQMLERAAHRRDVVATVREVMRVRCIRAEPRALRPTQQDVGCRVWS